MYDKFKNEIDKLKRDCCFRTLKPVEKHGQFLFLDGKKYLNLNSNDYLAVAGDEKIRQDFLGIAKEANYSLGSTSSRLLCGNDSAYQELENLLASLYKKPALIFNSGYHANVGIISALAGKGDVVFSDKLNHASIIDGIKLSGADFHRYKHLDYDRLRELLEKNKTKNFKNIFIITESLFSMDGDVADLKKLVELKEEFNAILIVDEAHAFGVYGEIGLGVSEKQNLVEKIDVIVATFGKSVGSMGAFCVADEILIDYLKNKARTLIFSTALPEINVAFSKHVIENIFPTLNDKRKHLFKTADKFRNLLVNKGFQTKGSSYIIPIIFGENELAVKMSEIALENGFYLMPIRHPTVAKGQARLRVSLTADINFGQIEKISDLLSL